MKVKRQQASLRYQVQNTLREEIVSGRMAPGERLVEQHLCDVMDVSRTSLREALRKLEAEGLVEIVPHRGAAVASVETEDARQIYQARGVLEALAVENFVAHAGTTEIIHLKALTEDLARLAGGRATGARLLEAKQHYYAVLLDIPENAVLRGMLEVLNNRVSLLRALSMNRSGRLVQTIDELRDITSAIAERDAPRAAQAVRLHLERASQNVHEILTEQTRTAS